MKTMKEELIHLKEELKRLEKTFEENIHDSGEGLLQKTEDTISNIAEKIKKETEPVIKSLQATGKHINEYVSQKKWQSIGVALVAGVITGLFIFRGKK